jgi:hypothetical protein
MPQHWTDPLLSMAQVWELPALTWVKVPGGGVDWPLPFWPQH